MTQQSKLPSSALQQWKKSFQSTNPWNIKKYNQKRLINAFNHLPKKYYAVQHSRLTRYLSPPSTNPEKKWSRKYFPQTKIEIHSMMAKGTRSLGKWYRVRGREELRSFDVLFTAPSASSRFKFPFNGFLIFQRCFIWHPMMHVKIVSGFVCLFIHQLNTFKCGTEHKKRGARKESENKSIRVFKVHFIRLFYIDYKGG